MGPLGGAEPFTSPRPPGQAFSRCSLWVGRASLGRFL